MVSEHRERDEHQAQHAGRDDDLGRQVQLAISIQSNDLGRNKLLVPEEAFDRALDVVAGNADVPEFPVVEGLKLVHRLLALPSPEPADDHSRKGGSRASIVVIRHVSLQIWPGLAPGSAACPKAGFQARGNFANKRKRPCYPR